MKLSEQLKRDHECGDFGQALSGDSERAKALEAMAERISYLIEGIERLGEIGNICTRGATGKTCSNCRCQHKQANAINPARIEKEGF